MQRKRICIQRKGDKRYMSAMLPSYEAIWLRDVGADTLGAARYYCLDCFFGLDHLCGTAALSCSRLVLADYFFPDFCFRCSFLLPLANLGQELADSSTSSSDQEWKLALLTIRI